MSYNSLQPRTQTWRSESLHQGLGEDEHSQGEEGEGEEGEGEEGEGEHGEGEEEERSYKDSVGVLHDLHDVLGLTVALSADHRHLENAKYLPGKKSFSGLPSPVDCFRKILFVDSDLPIQSLGFLE